MVKQDRATINSGSPPSCGANFCSDRWLHRPRWVGWPVRPLWSAQRARFRLDVRPSRKRCDGTPSPSLSACPSANCSVVYRPEEFAQRGASLIDLSAALWTDRLPLRISIPHQRHAAAELRAQRRITRRKRAPETSTAIVYLVWFEQSSTPHPTQYRSFRRRSSQPIT